MSKDEKFEMIARWIHSECDTPISEIEWLLRGYMGDNEKILENEYDAVFEWKKEKEWDKMTNSKWFSESMNRVKNSTLKDVTQDWIDGNFPLKEK